MIADIRAAIEGTIFDWSSSDVLFNPYASDHPAADRPGAHQIRRANLMNYLKSFSFRPDVLIVGEAPGPRGCRFSGVPFTSERQLCCGQLPFVGEQSSASAEPHNERTATIFWDGMAKHHPRCFIWNAVPLHPHLSGDPFSLRRPSGAEVNTFADMLAEIVRVLRPVQIVAVGRVAEQAVRNIGESPVYVWHPSRGGAKEFHEGIAAIFAGE